MKSSKKWLWALLMIAVIVMIGMLMPRETYPSADTRVIVDHTYQTYIAPICFEESNATNFLAESTLKEAESLNYPPHSPCTEEALDSEDDRLLSSLLKELGILSKKWDDW
ncbi:hypothetical protein [Sporosarcina ureilytica]|uniref:Uncharacterized protein n=1 Tax=Sporosarcina ureilytica TaxID=298596 RepID=A0A1D8JDZ1_9BACL|nr:hypothetical protein [Sporosarcina ureilytica]AOV06935.1 hypothetical protein BI350_04695 [Sporosarcina ureilytica]